MPRSGHTGLNEMLESGFEPDVAVCSSDSTAQGVIIKANHRGLDVPKQLAVMGFGNMDSAVDIEPSLSTVRIDPTKIGTVAATALLDKINGKVSAERVLDLGFHNCALART
jgi:LacI family transcriptional regulator, gluconate utilization system Gnt-I transcriptional repressor